MNNNFLSTGNILLDSLLPNAGIKKGTMSFVMGLANIGTSVFLISLACNMLRDGKKVLYIDLEHSTQDLSLKFLSNLSQIRYSEIKTNEKKIQETINKFNLNDRFLSNLDIYRPNISPNIEDTILYCKNTKQYDIIIIDYFQLFQSNDQKNMIHHQYLTKYIVESLNQLSIDLNCAIISPYKVSFLFDKVENITPELSLTRFVDTIFYIKRIETELNISVAKPKNEGSINIDPNIEKFDFLPYNPNYAKKLKSFFDKES